MINKIIKLIVFVASIVLLGVGCMNYIISFTVMIVYIVVLTMGIPLFFSWVFETLKTNVGFLEYLLCYNEHELDSETKTSVSKYYYLNGVFKASGIASLILVIFAVVDSILYLADPLHEDVMNIYFSYELFIALYEGIPSFSEWLEFFGF